MRTKVGFAIVVAAVVLAVVAYALWRPSAPAPASGGEPPKTVVDEVAEARAIVARLNARSKLAASGEPIMPMPDAVRRGPEGQGEVDERKAAAALQKLRAQMEFERQSAQEPIPKVGAIMGGTGRFEALIGEAFVSEGDVVRGYRVKKIQADSVEFERDGKTWVQKVN